MKKNPFKDLFDTVLYISYGFNFPSDKQNAETPRAPKRNEDKSRMPRVFYEYKVSDWITPPNIAEFCFPEKTIIFSFLQMLFISALLMVPMYDDMDFAFVFTLSQTLVQIKQIYQPLKRLSSQQHTIGLIL
ncbi:MAG: hypothetical protein EZS28_012333 [Streblomastix strix]|uniref:Uncharacterized protein n=1 Tax=Streblomastix strix TaxID=222440 RepID=A0A5J4WB28_9EUKA|nr:MAG: hypothetical protein EZS28_012333 [Streblomastix strix]